MEIQAFNMLSKEEEKLVDECIESHRRMIKFHRKQILDLVRKKTPEPEIPEVKPLEIKIIKK